MLLRSTMRSVRPPTATRLALLGFAASLVACRTPSTSTDAPLASAAAAPSNASAAVASNKDLAARLCAGRDRCSIRKRRDVPGTEKMEIVDVALGRGPGDDECDGAEYWLVRHAPPSVQRIARDCDEQTEADALGHAETRIEDGDFTVAYQEGRSADRCAGVDARLHLSPLHLSKETRFDGSSSQRRCRRDNEIATDWDGSDHVAHFTSATCDAKPSVPTRPAAGAAIPKITLEGSTTPTAVGSCGVLIDATRAARWMKNKAIATNARLRAVMVNDYFLIDVEGVTSGTIAVTTASAAPGDGNQGSLGCASDDERSLSVTTLHLEDGRIEPKGSQAPFLKLASREGAVIHLATERMASIGRLAVSYESPTHERLDSASLPRTPTAGDLPPLYGPFKSNERCQLEAGRLNVRPQNATMDPAVKLQ